MGNVRKRNPRSDELLKSNNSPTRGREDSGRVHLSQALVDLVISVLGFA